MYDEAHLAPLVFLGNNPLLPESFLCFLQTSRSGLSGCLTMIDR